MNAPYFGWTGTIEEELLSGKFHIFEEYDPSWFIQW